VRVRGLIKGADVTKNAYTAALSHVFTIALKEFGVVDQNPCLKISKLKNPRGRVRYLSDEERKKLLVACEESANPYLYAVVLLALTTGARKMEIMNLTWSDIDFDKRQIYLNETKNGEIRTLILTEPPYSVLLGLFRGSKTHLAFPSLKNTNKPIELKHCFIQALRRAGVTNFHFHDLRHSCASYLVMNGASLNEIAEILGHKSLNMVKRYAHLSTTHISGVVNRMAEKMFKE
jgi:integrase